MFDPTNSADVSRLAEAVADSRWRLEPFRVKRLNALTEFVGRHYSDSGTTERVPLNLLQLACHIYMRQLVPAAPRVMITSREPQLRPVAADMQAWMESAIQGMRLHETLRLWALNAYFGLGILKIGEAPIGEIMLNGTTQLVGQPFAQVVSTDDWVHDMTARRYDQVQFAGNRYRMPLSDARSSPLFDPTERAKLTATTNPQFNERGEYRATALSQSDRGPGDELEECCELWEIYLPRYRLVLTLPYDDSPSGLASRPLRIVRWEGPRHGPFRLLTFGDVPDNIMPVSPASALIDMHELANLVWNKLADQAERTKTILGVQGAASKDGEHIIRAKDGDVVKIDNPDKAKDYHFGAVDQLLLLFAVAVKDSFTWQAGNLDTLGGLSPQAGTLGQEELLNRQSSAQMAELAARVTNGTKEVLGDLGYWWWSNPHMTYTASRDVGGMEIPVTITPQMRAVPWERLKFDLDPYSMQAMTPAAKLSSLMQILQTVVLPNAQPMMQQGITVKWAEVVALLARYGNLPELETVLAIGPPPDMMGAVQAAQELVQRMPTSTNRSYTRINRPGMTRQGQSDVMSQLLAGGGQPKQAAMMGRPTG